MTSINAVAVANQNASIAWTEVKRECDRRTLHVRLNTCCSTKTDDTTGITKVYISGFNLTTYVPVERNDLTFRSFGLISKNKVVRSTEGRKGDIISYGCITT